VTILYTEGGTQAQQDEAHQVLAVLCAAYPGHPWAVRVDQGIVFIRHLELGSNWGMNTKWRNIDHDAGVFKREIIRKAGEFLERAGLVRGRANGDEIARVEGLPEKYQPASREAIMLKQTDNDKTGNGPLIWLPTS
jgi:hypothetical protein